MSDLISTQESVAKIVDTAIRKILSGEQKLTKEYEQSVIDAVDVILNTARREAHHEIIRCKECRYKELKGVDYFCDHITGEGIMVSPNDYCSWAEKEN